MFLNGGNLYLTSRFCKDKFDLISKSNMVSESGSRSVGSLAINFPLSSHPLFISTHEAQ